MSRLAVWVLVVGVAAGCVGGDSSPEPTSVDVAAVVVAPPSTPVPISPLDLVTLADEEPLRWEPSSEAAAYDIEIRQIESIAGSPHLAFTVSAQEAGCDLAGPCSFLVSAVLASQTSMSDWWWRVRASNELGPSDWTYLEGFLYRDNCRGVFNPDQQDTDGDGKGDACDGCPTLADHGYPDPDGDGISNRCDNCKYIASNRSGVSLPA